MDLYIQAKAAERLFNILIGKEIGSEAEFTAQKGESFLEVGENSGIPAAIPEEVGIDSLKLTEMLSEMEKSKEANVHTVTVIKDGRLIINKGFYPYRADIRHVTHSASKTITALAVGILVTRGLLNTEKKLLDIFESESNLISKLKLGKITVKHLLTMTSGLAANELMIVSEKDWLKAALDSTCNFEPGSKFQYNSINSYLLSCIVEKITGQNMFIFLKENLFSKLSIENVFWENCPSGRTKGGWGLYMLPIDLCKIGLFMLQGGKIDGETVISEEYIAEMTVPAVQTDESLGLDGYGYQVWTGKREKSFVFNGMLGQNVHCFPDINTVVAVTGGNHQLFGRCKVNEIIEKYFAKDLIFAKGDMNKRHYKAFLKKSESLINPVYNIESKKSIFKTAKQPKEIALLNGKCFKMESSNLHLEPFFSRLVSNSYPESISEIAFLYENGLFSMKVKEGECENLIPLGFDDFTMSNIYSNGECFTVMTKAQFTFNEDKIPVLKISMPFIECAGGRIIKIFIESENSIRVKTEEKPGRKVIEEGFMGLSYMFPDKGGSALLKKIDPQIVKNLALTVTEPESEGFLKE